jgi:hypothetical protein
MPCALLGIVVAAVALPLSLDRAGDAQVAWDLIDLPFSIDESLLGKLLQHEDAESAPIKKDLGLLHRKFKSNSTGADASEAEETWHPHRGHRPQLRGASQPALKTSQPTPKDARPLAKGVRRKPLVWVHLHKAGGTLMCKMAKLNENVVQPENNCNWAGHDGWKQSGQPSVRKSCSERAQMFDESGYTYGQIEREMDDDEVCEEFRYGIMFREPLALMQSIVNFELWYQTKKEHSGYSQPFLEFPPDMAEWLRGKIEEKAVPGNELVPLAWLDNFQTRFLANAFDVPVGQINEEHLARARAFLHKKNFTVQALEDLPRQGEMLFHKLGWKWRKGILQARHNSFEKIQRDPREETEYRVFTPEEEEYLRGLNKYDVELYKGARDLASVQSAEP